MVLYGFSALFPPLKSFLVHYYRMLIYENPFIDSSLQEHYYFNNHYTSH